MLFAVDNLLEKKEKKEHGLVSHISYILTLAYVAVVVMLYCGVRVQVLKIM